MIPFIKNIFVLLKPLLFWHSTSICLSSNIVFQLLLFVPIFPLLLFVLLADRTFG